MPGRPVVFRTLDIGGDKPRLRSRPSPETNPALGVRGLRLGLRRPELFETQLRAMLEADAGRAAPDPAADGRDGRGGAAARRAIDRGRRSVAPGGGAAVATDVRLGVMVEVPAVAIVADAFAPIVDFFSIGTNDLVQYTLAADRTNPALAELATPLQPAVLRLIRSVAEAAAALRPAGRGLRRGGSRSRWRPRCSIGLGVDELSVAPGSIGPPAGGTRWHLDVAACREAPIGPRAAADVAEVREIAAALLRPAPVAPAGSTGGVGRPRARSGSVRAPAVGRLGLVVVAAFHLATRLADARVRAPGRSSAGSWVLAR